MIYIGGDLNLRKESICRQYSQNLPGPSSVHTKYLRSVYMRLFVTHLTHDLVIHDMSLVDLRLGCKQSSRSFDVVVYVA